MRRRIVLAFAALPTLTACVSTLQSAYDERDDQEQCNRARGQIERAMCPEN